MEELNVITDEDISSTQSFKLENFEGPLDLLLHLIRSQKLDVKTVKIAEITDQYLSILQDFENLDLNVASEFIEMAATLLVIKSRSLLPKIEDDPEDPEMILRQQLQLKEEYKLFQEISSELVKKENINKFYKEPEPEAHNFRFVLKEFKMEALLDALVDVLKKVDFEQKLEEPKFINKDRFTVSDKIISIKSTLLKTNQVTFDKLFDDDYSKLEVITTFMALLELIKEQFVSFSQKNIYGEIILTRVDNNE